MKKTIILPILFLCACGNNVRHESKTVYVSIAPLAYLVEQIADSSVVVKVLVPETTSPETYEPSAAQIREMSKAQIYIGTGLIDFERELNKSVTKLSDSLRVIDLSKGIEVLSGSCAHSPEDDHGHSHGIDPHTWLSPKLMRGFALRIKDALDESYPQSKEVHATRLADLIGRIDSLDSYIRSKTLVAFAIAHPSLTYFAHDYGVEQISIEMEGKEPSIAQMKEMIEELRREKITKVFYQKQTSAAAAQTIANEVGARIIEFDPLALDWISNLRFITDNIAK